jgi:DNA-binding transcriptional LysR family regulator
MHNQHIVIRKMAMTPKQLEVFISIVQLGSVTAAAAQLAMSQPSVSKSLALIEQQMGFSLFERYQGKMQPTAEARALYKEALRVHQDRLRFERFVDHIRQYRVGQLRVCATPALALNILPLAVARFRQSFPDYGVVADMCLNNEIETAVEEGRYDLGFLVKPGYEPEENPLAICRGEMVCAARAASAGAADGNPLAGYPDTRPGVYHDRRAAGCHDCRRGAGVPPAPGGGGRNQPLQHGD